MSAGPWTSFAAAESEPSVPGRSDATRRKHPRWSFLSVGAVLAVAIWLVASDALTFYVSKFGSYNEDLGLTVRQSS